MKGIYWLGLGIASFQAFMINPCVAQSSNIIPDNSLGGESSQINENPQQLPPGFSQDKIETITGGAQRGINLFHSFREFNVSEGRGAYFFSPNAEVQNILTRVTGRNTSEILGTLGTFGNSQPNLYLINPNGIVFGENASLDVGGSFVASTANGINLGETGFFSATEPEKSNLLSVNPSALFFNAVNTQAGIVNRSTATSTVLGSSLNGDANRPINGLQVLDGKSLLLVGGDVSLDGGRLFAPGGRVELGGLGEAGKVGLGINGDIFSLNFPQGVQRGDISLTNESRVNTLAGGGGGIAVNARNMDVSRGSKIDTGIGVGLGTVDSQAGDITLNVTGEVNVTDSGSRIGNNVQRGAEGNGGNINVDADSFNLEEGAQLIASTFGKGNAGNVTVSAKDAVSLTGGGDILSTVEAGGVGNGGNIDINAAALSLSDGAQLLTIIREASDPQPPGKGDAGNINLKVSGGVNIAGKSGLFSLLQTSTEGNGGNITVETGSLNLAQGAELNTSTSGNGNAGNVTVTAKDAIFLTDGGILSTVELGGVGKGGNIDINAANLTLRDGAQLLTITSGGSDTQPAGKGDAGNINLKVSGAVDIAGKNTFPSGLLSGVEADTQGNGGNITVNAGSFSLRDGALLIASTFGKGDAGNVTITAKDAVFLTDADIVSTLGAGAVGKGSNIDMNAATLTLQDNAQLVASTSGNGNAGNVTVITKDAISLTDANILSSVEAGGVGKGGNIDMNAATLTLQDNAQLVASTFGKGDAGNVKITAKDAVSLAGNTAIFSTVEAGGLGKGGNIDINAATLTLQDNAQLQTNTRSAQSDTQPAGKGDAGNITLKLSGAVDISGKSTLLSVVETGTEGNGGNITVEAGSLNLAQVAVLSASTSGNGNAGNVTVKAKDAIFLTDSGILSTVEAGGIGKGGNIDINAATLTLRDGAQIQTITRRGASDPQPPGKGDAGDINVKVTSAVDIAGERDTFLSGLFSEVQIGTEGNGGNITVEAGSLNLARRAEISASTFGNGNAGTIEVHAAEFFTVSNPNGNFSTGLFVDSQSTGSAEDIIVNSPKVTLDGGTLNAESFSGNGGNINLTSDLLLLRRGAEISTNAGTAQQGGDGGNIDINSKFIVALPQENSDITANAFSGTGGNVNIPSQGIFGIEPRTQQTDKSDITASSELGVPGVINLTDPDDSSIRNNLDDLPENQIDTNALIANSCISRSANRRQENFFIITGPGGLRNSPGDGFISKYSTGDVRNVEPKSQVWKKGDVIVEPQGLYKLPDGRLLLSRSC